MATLSVADLREHSGMNSKKSAESDTTSKKSSIHDGPSKPDGGKIKRLSIAPGASSGPNQGEHCEPPDDEEEIKSMESQPNVQLEHVLGTDEEETLGKYLQNGARK